MPPQLFPPCPFGSWSMIPTSLCNGKSHHRLTYFYHNETPLMLSRMTLSFRFFTSSLMSAPTFYLYPSPVFCWMLESQLGRWQLCSDIMAGFLRKERLGFSFFSFRSCGFRVGRPPGHSVLQLQHRLFNKLIFLPYLRSPSFVVLT